MRFMDGKRTLARAGMVLALVGIEIYLAHDLTASGPMMGFTLTKSVSVAPQRQALVKSVAVQLGASVTAGQVIAELDTTEIDNELAAAKADRDHAIATIQAQLRMLAREGKDLERRVEWSAERATATLAIADAQSHTANAELTAIDTEITEQKELVAKHLADTVVLNQLVVRRATLSKQVDTSQQVLGVLRGNAVSAEQRSSDVDNTNGVESALAPLEAAVRAAELHVDQLENEKSLLTLHAPIDGVVDQLTLHAGDLAAPNAPVATIVAPDTKRVVACVPEARSASVEVGSEAELTSAYAHSKGTGAVESITNEIAPLPTRCQIPGSKAVAMGRVAVVALDAPMPGLPGETQLVRFAARRRSTPAKGATPTTVTLPPTATSSPTQVVGLKVPGTLLGRTRFEASGLAWVPALRRYLIVSDDTGFKDRDNHAPWLFTMTADGTVDPEPYVVRGVDELDDIESITIDDQGAAWLMSSTSLSKKGKRPASRRRLVHASLLSDGASVLGTFDMGAMLDKISQAQRVELGLPDPAQLDVEALAWHDGALYIGLKAPVDDAGRAIIWKIAHPDRLLAGDVPGAQLTLWSRIKLTVEADGRQVPGGLADMMFLDAQTLVVTSTASGLDPQEQASILAVARVAEGEMTAKTVRSFAGLKAEGIAVAPGGKELAVVFDRGSEPAQWVKVNVDELGHAR